MKQAIIDNIDNTEGLENLFRENKKEFVKAFEEVSIEYNSDLIKFWKIRLSPEIADKTNLFSGLDILTLIIIGLITGFLMKLPAYFPHLKEEFFYSRNLAIIVFNGIILYTFWQNKIFTIGKILFYGLAILVLGVFLNLLPDNFKSSTVVLSIGHTPFLLLSLYGLSYMSFDYKNQAKKLEFIKFNGELYIMCLLITLAGGILTGITIGLFSAIKMNIENFYMHWIVVFGACATPIVSAYLIKIYPAITSKIAPVIAKVFTPLVFITLLIFSFSMLFTKVNITEDRELLKMFNIMLIAVVAIIIFSISELDKTKKKNFNVLILFLLASLTIIINTIAIGAIITRVFHGLTPNRIVVLVSNVLVFINLILIARNLYLSYYKDKELNSVENVLVKYLTVYSIWIIIVVFVFPFLFWFK